MKIMASRLVATSALAMDQAGTLSLSELAVAVRSGVSSVQKALRLLIDDGLVASTGERKQRRYRLTQHAAVAPLLSLAAVALPPMETLQVAARANRAIEFLAVSDGDLVAVLAAGADVDEESRAAGLLRRTAENLDLRPVFLDHDDVRHELLASAQLRERMATAVIVHGDLDHSFPDRSRHRRAASRFLGRPHESLHLPAREALRGLAQRHGVEALSLYGSAVRSDFRDDSDVDVLVRFRDDVRSPFQSLQRLELELERVTGRDVDVLRVNALSPEFARDIEAESVRLL
jgi:predicted nucleotidyltransferase